MIDINFSTFLLIFACIANLLLMIYLEKIKKKTQLHKVFIIILSLLFFWSFMLILQIGLSNKLNIKPIYFDYLVYIAVCFLPVFVFFMGYIFANTKLVLKKKFLLLFVIPITSLLVLWTNDIHHLFYEVYSVNLNDCIAGPYTLIHNIYTYSLLFIGILYLLKFSIKNSGFFSNQSLLITLAIIVPVVTNLLGIFRIFPMTIYFTPITLTFSILCCAFAIFKFNFLAATPIALQKVVDRISDSFVVLDDTNTITDFNKPFLKTFNLFESNIRGKNIEELIFEKNTSLDKDMFIFNIEKAKNSNKTITLTKEFKKLNKYFTIEINNISSDSYVIGTLVLFKDITQHVIDMQKIQDNQETLMERERLASLGQLIGRNCT